MCEAKPNSQLLTAAQAAVFLCYAAVYIVAEIVLLVVTARLFCANASLAHNLHAFVFYCAFHITLLSSAVYFLGGTICYGATMYEVAANLPYLAQGVGALVLLFQMANSYHLISPTAEGEDDDCASSYNRSALALSLAYSIAFCLIMRAELNVGPLHYFYLYNLACHASLGSALIYQSRNLYSEIVERYPTLLTVLRRRAWGGVILTVTTLMFSRAVLAAADVSGLNGFLRDYHHELFVASEALFFAVFELLPCVVFIFFMHMQLDSAESPRLTGSTRASNGVEGYRAGKKGWHTPTCSFSLAEEMVDNEGIDPE